MNMQHDECRMMNDESIHHSQFIIHNSRRRRRGVTILEVLFAILVTSVGLLGAIALFPVASSLARRARILEASSAAGRTAVHTFDAVGMRRPDRWLGYVGASGIYWDFPPSGSTLSIPTPYNPYPITNFRFPPGTAFCIDPRMVAANSGSVATATAASLFPYASGSRVLDTSGTQYPFRQFDPRMFRITLTGGPSPITLPIGQFYADRIFQIEDDLAFMRPGNDDVTNMPINPTVLTGTKFTNDRTLPAIQRFGLMPDGTLGSRQTQGRYSWMATLVPQTDVYSVASGAPTWSARGLGSSITDQYLLSIVVFYNRPADLAFQTNSGSVVTDPYHERVVDVSFFDNTFTSDGSSGGEVLLHWTATQSGANDKLAADYLKVRPSDWIMLSGNEYLVINGVVQASVPRFRWYRVTHCDHEPTYNAAPSGSPFTSSPGYELYVTLSGADWPAIGTSQTTSSGNNSTTISNFTANPHLSMMQQTAEATLVEGVVAVFEKTVRLEYGSTY
jgi:type II secretory pathway pseudopilin PulG